MRKTREEQFLKKFLNLEKNLLKLESNYKQI